MSSTKIAAKPGEPWKKGDGPESEVKPGTARNLLDHWNTITRLIETDQANSTGDTQRRKPVSLRK